MTEASPAHKLYAAVQEYVEAHGGKVVVAGPVEVQQWPGDLEFTFRLAVKFTGRRPQAPTPPEEER